MARNKLLALIYLLKRYLKRSSHRTSIFYREGVSNANQLVSPASDEFDLPKAWIALASRYNIPLQVCVAAALRRGVVDEQQAKEQGLLSSNMATKFELSGLGALAQAMLTCDRVVQF